MAIIQRRGANNAQDMAAIAGIIMQVLQYKQQQDAVALKQTQQKSYGEGITKALKPYEETYRTEMTQPTEADRYGAALRGMSTSQFDKMLKPYPTSFKGKSLTPKQTNWMRDRDVKQLRGRMDRTGLKPTERKIPIAPRYNIPADQRQDVLAKFLQVGAGHPRETRIDPRLMGMFDKPTSRDGAGHKVMKHVDAQQRTAWYKYDPSIGKMRFVGGDPDTEFTARQQMTWIDQMGTMTGKGLPTKAGVYERQKLYPATDAEVGKAKTRAMKNPLWNRVEAQGKLMLIEEILKKQKLRLK